MLRPIRGSLDPDQARMAWVSSATSAVRRAETSVARRRRIKRFFRNVGVGLYYAAAVAAIVGIVWAIFW